MEIVRKSQRVHVEQYYLEYDRNDLPGAGFMFACDKQGNLLLDQITLTARQNLVDCQSGVIAVTFKGVRDCSYTYLQPAQGRCSCSRIIELSDPMTNSCACGLEYNGGGQSLSPRSQWEEPWDDDGLRAWGDGIEAFEYAGGL